MRELTNKQAALQDAKFFNAVLNRLPNASAKTIKVKSKKDCIGKSITLVGTRRIKCRIVDIYFGNCFKMISDDNVRHNVLIKSVYKNKTLKTEIKAIV